MPRARGALSDRAAPSLRDLAPDPVRRHHRPLREEVRRPGCASGASTCSRCTRRSAWRSTRTSRCCCATSSRCSSAWRRATRGYEHDDFARRFDIAAGRAGQRTRPLPAAAADGLRDAAGRGRRAGARPLAVGLRGRARRPTAPRARDPAGRRLSRVAAQRRGRDQTWSSSSSTRQLLVDPEPVAAPMRRLVEAGGKRLRPRLVQLTAQHRPRATSRCAPRPSPPPSSCSTTPPSSTTTTSTRAHTGAAARPSPPPRARSARSRSATTTSPRRRG